MSLQRCIIWVNSAFAVSFSANVSTASAQQKPLTADQTQIVNTVSVIFAAARTDDVAKFDSVIAPDFYIYDGGVRFTGDTVMAMIKAQHAAGKRHERNLTEPDLHITRQTAWIKNINQGSHTDFACNLSQKRRRSGFLPKQWR